MSVVYWLRDSVTRRASLRNLLIFETMSEGRFDLLVEYAALQFGVFAAQLDLDSKFRSIYRGAAEWRAPHDLSLFTQAMPPRGSLVVADSHAEPRFSRDPATGARPFFRFYAGIVIDLADGSRAGVLSLADIRGSAEIRAKIGHTF